jgi:hypothetical protein
MPVAGNRFDNKYEGEVTMKIKLRTFCISIVAGLCALAPLQAPAVVIPLRADATLSTVSGEENTNFGFQPTLIANTATRKALVKFEALSKYLPAGADAGDVAKAVLHIYTRAKTDAAAQLILTLVTGGWFLSSIMHSRFLAPQP